MILLKFSVYFPFKCIFALSELLFILSPSWNARTDFCVECESLRTVESCKKFRPRILHGNRQVFHAHHKAQKEHYEFAKLYQRTALALSKVHAVITDNVVQHQHSILVVFCGWFFDVG